MSRENLQQLQVLGTRLRSIREKLHESLAEVSGALEIDVEVLARIENGEQRPNEDTLLLLISHFSVKEDEAKKLWELAGYIQGKPTENPVVEDVGTNPYVFAMPMDVRVVYTDMVHVMVNNYGVVINFMQGAGPNNQPLAVSRVGMSKEHAQSVLEVLKQTLEQSAQASKPKSLPAPGETSS